MSIPPLPLKDYTIEFSSEDEKVLLPIKATGREVAEEFAGCLGLPDGWVYIWEGEYPL